jgi:uncharacterized repeat protein (TIGR01451 family)
VQLSTFKSSFLSATLVCFSFALQAATPGSVSLKNIAEMEVKVIENGVSVIKRVPVQKALPDAEIIYTTTFKNLIDKPVGDIVVQNPVPNDSIYKSGSAIGSNTVISYSVNGGKSYGAPDTLKVKTKDGKERQALASEYTHIKWIYQGALAAGKSSDISFRTVVK